MHKTIIFITVFFVPTILTGQHHADFRYFDSITYSLYMNKDWEALIIEGKQALDGDLDYYYMRMRLGIAYYELHNYAASSKHFKKALIFNQGDNTASEYLFYSLYLSGRILPAKAVLWSMSKIDRERVELESQIKRNTITAEYFSSNAKSGDIIENPGDYFHNNEPGSQIVTRSFSNYAVYASHILGKNIMYSHAYTRLVKDNYLYYFDGQFSADMKVQEVKQNQYYGSVNFYTSGGLILSPAFHIIGTRYPFFAIDYTGSRPLINEYKVKNMGYATSFRIAMLSGYSSISAEGSYSELNFQKQAQSGISVIVYPFGNSRFHIGGSLYSIFPVDQTTGAVKYVTGITTGFSISDKVWFDFKGSAGEMKNYLENNGLFVYNSSDYPTGKVLVGMMIPLTKPDLKIYIAAGRSWHLSEWIPADGTLDADANILKYFNNVFTGGITWNF